MMRVRRTGQYEDGTWKRHDGEHLEQTDRLAHRRLDVQGLDVLPVLLEQ